jgi:lysozyme
MINTIIDMRHGGLPDFAAAKAAGIVAVIHKATEGGTFQDPEYRPRRDVCKRLGLLWGSYHFVSGVSVTDQIANYLNWARPAADELMCVDYEHSTSGQDMTREQLERMVVLLEREAGRFPTIYGGDLLRYALGLEPSPVLAQCSLWYARYAESPIGIPAQVWSQYALWQYTNGAKGPLPHEVPGIGRCDRSMFNGTTEDLRAQWPNLVSSPHLRAESPVTTS